MEHRFDRLPVIVGVGEITQHTKDPTQAQEPLVLMERALRAAEADSGAPLLPLLDSLDVVLEASWPYVDAPGQLSRNLNVTATRLSQGPVGGETPISLLHEAALRISRGETKVAAIVGAEAQYAVSAASKAGIELPWSPRDAHAKIERGVDYLQAQAVSLGVATPATVYPFYENAAQAAWGQTPSRGREESGRLWAACSEVAAENPYSWQSESFSAEAISNPGPGNRMVAWPYTVRMVANPMVNQGAAILVTSLGQARQMGIPAERLIHVWCGAAASEPRDYLERDQFVRVHAQEAVLERIVEQVGNAGPFASLELYSCFPIVPKMARRTLALPDGAPTTCTGGLSFFGAPLNNYMTHATASMVRALRGRQDARGLLYGQGGYLTKHHALVIGTTPAPNGMVSQDYDVQSVADSRRGSVPHLASIDYAGAATIETFTTLYQRDGAPQYGVVIARTPSGDRLIARVPASDQASIACLTDLDRSAVGQVGAVHRAADGLAQWGLPA